MLIIPPIPVLASFIGFLLKLLFPHNIEELFGDGGTPAKTFHNGIRAR